MLKTSSVKSKSAFSSRRFYILLFLTVSVIAVFFPPTTDDLAWATSNGESLLASRFKDYNGRYLGNLSEYFLTRVPYLLPLVKGATVTASVFLIQRFIPQRNEHFLYISAFLILVPGPLFMQAFVWTAGFVNYMLPLLLISACMYLLFFKRELRGSKRIFAVSALFIMGAAGQLFMEHYAICCIVVAAAACVYYVIKNRRPDLYSSVYLIACASGASIMFSNGAYRKVIQGEDIYQSFASESSSLWGILKGGLFNMSHNISHHFLSSCFPALIFITVLLCVMLKKNTDVNSKLKKTVCIVLILSGASIIVFPVVYMFTKDFIQAKISFFLIICGVLFSCGIMIKNCVSLQRRKRIGIYLLIIAVQAAQLCFVVPTGARCFCGIHMLLILIAGELFYEFETEYGYEAKRGTRRVNVFRLALTVLLAVDLVCYSFVFFANMHKIKIVREEAAKGVKHITIEHTPLRFMVFGLDNEEYYGPDYSPFCEYYGLPEGTLISFK